MRTQTTIRETPISIAKSSIEVPQKNFNNLFAKPTLISLRYSIRIYKAEDERARCTLRSMEISKLVKARLGSARLLIISRLTCISTSHFKILTNMYNTQGRHGHLIICGWLDIPHRPRQILAGPFLRIFQNGIICIIVRGPCRWALILRGDEELSEGGDTRDNNRYRAKVSIRTATWPKPEITYQCPLQQSSRNIASRYSSDGHSPSRRPPEL